MASVGCSAEHLACWSGRTLRMPTLTTRDKSARRSRISRRKSASRRRSSTTPRMRPRPRPAATRRVERARCEATGPVCGHLMADRRDVGSTLPANAIATATRSARHSAMAPSAQQPANPTVAAAPMPPRPPSAPTPGERNSRGASRRQVAETPSQRRITEIVPLSSSVSARRASLLKRI